MKTLIIYQDFEGPLEFLLVDGDYSRFNGVMVNSATAYSNNFEDEFVKWMFNPESGERNHSEWTTDTNILEWKNWDKVAICVFLP